MLVFRQGRRLVPAIAIVVYLMEMGPVPYQWASVQAASPLGRLVSEGEVSASGFLSWVSARPVGMRLEEAGDHRAVIGSLQAGGAAERAGLTQGDILLRVGDLKAPSPDKAAEQIENAWAAGTSAVDLVVRRAGHDFYVALRLRQ